MLLSSTIDAGEQSTFHFGSLPRAVEVRLLGALCVLILVGILIAGLWPFHSPRNGVTWLTETDGVRLGGHGTLLTPEAINPPPGQSVSLELWVRPLKSDASRTLLAVSDSQGVRRFSIRQDSSDLELRSELQDGKYSTRTSRMYVDKVFHAGVLSFITVVSRAGGISVYRDGALVKDSSWSGLSSTALTGQLVVGTSPVENDDWSGEIRGIAIYGQALEKSQVSQHYQAWMRQRGLDIAHTEHPIAFYLFDEHAGNAVRNLGSSGFDLEIPAKYRILHEKFLEPLWMEFDFSWGYWDSALVNVGGFIPFGFFFAAYLSRMRQIRRPALVTIVLGATVSLTIEVLQSYMHTRDSGTTDFITNTLGTEFGVMLYAWKPLQGLLNNVFLYITPASKRYGRVEQPDLAETHSSTGCGQ